jgi:FkbM family methyltransferase
MRKVYIKIFEFFSIIYLSIFGRKFFFKFNLILLKLILKSIGYQNFGSYNFTGEKDFVKSIKRFKPRVCIDIGAHTGSFSDLLIEELDCKVISFEPNHYSFKKLKQLKSKYGDKFYAYNYAITNKNKKTFLYYGSKESQLASLSKNLTKINFIKKSNKNKMPIKGITLDSFFIKNKIKFKQIDFIKIDTEGHEFEVLIGAKKTIKKYKPNFIQLEFNWHQLYKKNTLLMFHELLNDYFVYRILPFGKSIVKIDSNRPENNIFHLSNVVFIKKKLQYEKN